MRVIPPLRTDNTRSYWSVPTSNRKSLPGKSTQPDRRPEFGVRVGSHEGFRPSASISMIPDSPPQAIGNPYVGDFQPMQCSDRYKQDP